MKFLTNLFSFLVRAGDVLRKVLHLIVLLIIFGLIIGLMSPRIPIVPQTAALVLAPRGAVVEQLSGDPLQRALAEAYGQGSAETLLRDLIDAVRAAQKDDRIKALVLDLGGMTGGGITKMEELSAAVREFKKSGKKVIAIGEGYDQTQYYVAANADEIYLDPQGVVLIEGYGYYRTFLKGAVDKLGVEINIFRAGTFKSATEQYSRAEMSPEDKEQSLAWLNSIWAQYQTAVTQARGLEPNAIAAYVNDFASAIRAREGDRAAVAMERGLITEIKSRHEVDEELKALVGEDEKEHTFRGVAHWDYLAATRQRQSVHHGDRIGVVVASGEILDGDQPPGTIGSDSAVRLLRKARYDDSVKAIVLRIDSPGGSMLASEIIRREINAIRAAGKPVVASMSSTAASGGYYIAMDADEIWASPTTLTGSIGVWAVLPTFQQTLEKIGITSDGVGTTELAGALNLGRSLSPQAKDILQASVDNAYSTFIGHVAAARKKPIDEIDSVAQGRVWAGNDAATHGLIDKLGSYRDALDAAAARANLGDDYKVEYIEPSLGWRQALAQQSQVLAARATRALVPEQGMLASARKLLSPIEAEIARLARFSEPMQTYYYCMCSVN
jgi:protease-4